MADMPEISIIIVTYNTADLIGPCLNSVYENVGVEPEVFVVDNASEDGTARVVEDRFPGVHLTTNGFNRGFAAANNQVLPLCRGRYIFYLNPDAKFTGSHDLKTALVYMDGHPQIGLAGCRLINPDGSHQESISRRYPGETYLDGSMSGLKGSIASVLGAAMIARGDLVRRLGGFDETFHLYGEDQDLCLRIRKAGYEIGHIDDAVVLHWGGQSERHSLPAQVWKKKTLAEFAFYRKHYPTQVVKRIWKADLLKARYRLLTLGLSIPFLTGEAKQRARGKRIKYRAVHETLKTMCADGRRERLARGRN